jgi:hypothetical protein
MMTMYFEGAGMFADKAFQEKLARNIKEDTFRNKTPLISIRMCNNNSSYGLGELDSSVDTAAQLPHRTQLNFAYFDTSGVLSGLINKVNFPNSYNYYAWKMLSAARGANVNPAPPSQTTNPTATPRPTTTPKPTATGTAKPTSTATPRPTATFAPSSNSLALQPVEDTFVRSDFQANGHPTFPLLRVLSSPEQISYLKFDLFSLAGSNITRVLLRLHVAAHDGAQSTDAVSIQPVTATWSGATMNYSNHPSALVSIASVIGSQTNTWVEADITSYIKSNTGKIISFALTTTSTDRTEFDSSESSFPPELVISLSSQQATSAPQPTATGAASKPGDANGDGKANGLDFAIWLQNYGQALSGPSTGDFDNNGSVNGLDFAIWLANYS